MGAPLGNKNAAGPHGGRSDGEKSALRAEALRQSARSHYDSMWASEPKHVWHTMSEEDKNKFASEHAEKLHAQQAKQKRSESARSRAYDRKTADIARVQAEENERERMNRRF